MSEIRLLPCPFCGGEAEIGVSAIWCTNEVCGAELYHPLLSREDLIKQWNTRKPMERIIERLVDLREKPTETVYDTVLVGSIIEICKEEGGIE